MAIASDDNYRRRREEALTWFVRINSGEATESERVDLAAWMAADVGNRAEFEKLSDIWTDLDRIHDPRESPRSARRQPVSRRFLLASGAAALGASAYVSIAGLPDFVASDFATAKGQLQAFSLPDGSSMQLDADSAVALDFTGAARNIWLRRGRAFFDVAADASRPFSVAAGAGFVTALGTRFTVHEWAGSVTVAVEESAVSVTGPGNTQMAVNAGQSISYDERGLDQVRAVDPVSESAWRRGKLIFEDRPLSQVLADVNRYRSGAIRVLDKRLLNMRVSGIFDVTNPDGVLDAIRSTLPVRAVQMTRYLVLLRPA